MKKNRILGVLCAGLMTTTLFAGCGSDADSKDSKEVTLKVLTHRTDLKDTVLKDIADEYYKEKGVKIEWEAITDYESVVKTRMNTEDYGDVLNILPAFTSDEFSQFFEPLGTIDELSDYIGITGKADGDTVYGIPNGLGANGIVYNKEVLKEAGWDTFPTTLDDLYKCLADINALDGVVPIAINSADLWPLSQYDSVATVAYGTPYYYRDMCTMDSPFSAGSPTGDVLEILYKFVSEGWVEDDLATTNWEQSKVDMANGKIGMMTLGMWAVPQIQANTENPDNINIAPFPTNNSGDLKAEAGPDNYLGVNVHSKHKEEAKDFVEFFANNLEYLDSQALIPSNKTVESNNEIVKAYQNSGVDLMFADPAEADQAASNLTTKIAEESGVKFWEGSYIQEAVIEAKKGREQFEAVINKLNEKWNDNKAKLSE